MPEVVSERTEQHAGSEPLASPLGHRLMFVLFVGLAFALFAPAILLPLVQEHGSLLAEEARLQRRINGLEAEIRRQESLQAAFATDATVNERLAILDLNYQRPDEEVLPVLPRGYTVASREPAGPPEFQSALQIPSHWPTSIRRWERWADRRGLIDPFLDSAIRPAILLMSGGLIIAAFVLFSPRVAQRKTGAAIEPSPEAVSPSPHRSSA